MIGGSIEDILQLSREIETLRKEADRAQELDKKVIQLQGEIGEWRQEAYRLGAKASTTRWYDRNVLECRVQLDEMLLTFSRANPREMVAHAFKDIAQQFELERYRRIGK